MIAVAGVAAFDFFGGLIGVAICSIVLVRANPWKED